MRKCFISAVVWGHWKPCWRSSGRSASEFAPFLRMPILGPASAPPAADLGPLSAPGLMTFAFTAMDQIVNQMAKTHYMLGGQATFPLVLRAATGSGRAAAAQHCQSSHPFFLNLAGLKLVMPSTPYDAKGLMKSAIRGNNPVVFFEHQAFALGGLKGPVPEEEYTISIGQAEVKRVGEDVTIVAIAEMVHEALTAAESLAGDGISAEVVDPSDLGAVGPGSPLAFRAEDGPGGGGR